MSQHEQPEANASPHEAPSRPLRIAFCTSWKLENDSLEITDEFDTLNANALPFEVKARAPMYAAVLWEGRSINLKSRFRVYTPSGEELSVRLPALKPYFWNQVQMVALTGFAFREAGPYRFVVETDTDSVEHILTITYTPPAISIGDS